jgi:hypothetical protein
VALLFTGYWQAAADYTCDATVRWVECTADATVTLPNIAKIPVTRTITVINNNKKVTVAAATGQMIMGAATAAVAKGDRITIMSNGLYWVVV